MIISEEVLKAFAEGAESVAKVTAGASTQLINEAINLFIVDAVLSILKFASVFVVFYIVKRYLDVMAETSDKKDMIKAAKTSALVASIIFFTSQSFPHIQEMSKALVAPKIFLMEKAASLIKK